jgi:hypothetical protein
MKLKNSAFALILTVIASSVALAADPPKTETPVPAKPKPEQVQPKEQKPMEITGSYIKRNIRRDGRITDGSSQVVVLDRGMIDRSGAADLKQVLIRQGIR